MDFRLLPGTTLFLFTQKCENHTLAKSLAQMFLQCLGPRKNSGPLCDNMEILTYSHISVIMTMANLCHMKTSSQVIGSITL